MQAQAADLSEVTAAVAAFEAAHRAARGRDEPRANGAVAEAGLGLARALRRLRPAARPPFVKAAGVIYLPTGPDAWPMFVRLDSADGIDLDATD